MKFNTDHFTDHFYDLAEQSFEEAAPRLKQMDKSLVHLAVLATDLSNDWHKAFCHLGIEIPSGAQLLAAWAAKLYEEARA